MASTYPTSADSFTAVTADTKTSAEVGGRTHSEMHNDLGDAVEAIQTEMGATPSGAYATVAARLAAVLVVPTSPTEITGEQGTDDTAILAAVLGVLDTLGLATDSTTTGA